MASRMGGPGAIPKAPRSIRNPLSEIGNIQHNRITNLLTLSPSYGYRSNDTCGDAIKKEFGKIAVVEELAKLKMAHQRMMKKFDQMKLTNSEAIEMNPGGILEFLEEKMETLEKEIAKTELKTRELENDDSNTTNSQINVVSSKYLVRENIVRERLNFFGSPILPEKKMPGLRKWPNTDNIVRDVGLGEGCSKDFKEEVSFREEYPGPFSHFEVSMTSIESDVSSSSENNCIDCKTTRDEQIHIEPKVVIVNFTKNVDSDEEYENKNENGVEVRSKLRDVVQVQKENARQQIQDIENKINAQNDNKGDKSNAAIQMQKDVNEEIQETENKIKAQNDDNGNEEPIYVDIKAFDFVAIVSRMRLEAELKRERELELEREKTEESNAVEALEEVNKSLGLEEDGVEDLQLKMTKLSVAALQSTKLIEFCIRNPNLKTSLERIEAESILLISGLKREMLNELNTRNEHLPKNGCIKISQIRMPLIYSPDAHPRIKRYYLVIFQGGDQLFSSGVLEPNRGSYLDITKPVIFEDLSSDFVIKASVYSMSVESRNKMSCLPFSFVRGIFRQSARRRAQVDPIICWEPREPSFMLHGQCEITISNLHKTPFTIGRVPNTICLINTLECTIETAVSLKNNEKGYLNIGSYRGNGSVSWRRRWCVLNGSRLKLWDEQRDEEDRSPEQLNLSRCLVQWECMKKCVCN